MHNAQLALEDALCRSCVEDVKAALAAGADPERPISAHFPPVYLLKAGEMKRGDARGWTPIGLVSMSNAPICKITEQNLSDELASWLMIKHVLFMSRQWDHVPVAWTNPDQHTATPETRSILDEIIFRSDFHAWESLNFTSGLTTQVINKLAPFSTGVRAELENLACLEASRAFVRPHTEVSLRRNIAEVLRMIACIGKLSPETSSSLQKTFMDCTLATARNPLEFAVSDLQGDAGLNAVRVLVNSGFPVNMQCAETGDTAIMKAANKRTKWALVALLELGADPTIPNADGNDVMSELSEPHNIEIAGLRAECLSIIRAWDVQRIIGQIADRQKGNAP